MRNKRKLINDPVHGFIRIPGDLIFDILEHPYFQRLRRIKQLGLTHLVYPGALHTRFHHALGSMHLMEQALDVLSNKDVEISAEEREGALIAILLHDIGHGPFSHALERSLVKNAPSHEEISLAFMNHLNGEFGGKLSLAIEIFTGNYEKKFLSQLVSSQLDMDRLDYLSRDSYFTGVSEGIVGTDRIIKMLNVVDNELVIDEKGVYSIEKYLISRRLMYWQVYLHKAVISAEFMLINVLRRAQYLVQKGTNLFSSPDLLPFLDQSLKFDNITQRKELLAHYASIDDSDITVAVKVWANHEDKILAYLCKSLAHRNLFKIKLQREPIGDETRNNIRQCIMKKFDISEHDSNYLMIDEQTSNITYHNYRQYLKVLFKDGSIKELSSVLDDLNISTLTKPAVKHFICYPEGCS